MRNRAMRLSAIVIVVALGIQGCAEKKRIAPVEPVSGQRTVTESPCSDASISISKPYAELTNEMQRVVSDVCKQCMTSEYKSRRALVYRIRCEEVADADSIMVKLQFGLSGDRGYYGEAYRLGEIKVSWIRMDEDMRLEASLPGYHQVAVQIRGDGDRIVVLDDLLFENVLPETTATVTGKVVLEDEADPSNITVKIGKNHSTVTDESGGFVLTGIESGKTVLSAKKQGYRRMYSYVTLSRGDAQEHDLHGYRERLAVVRWAYQPNGSRELAGEDLQEGVAVIRDNGLDRVSFKEGFTQVQGKSDFCVYQKEDKLQLYQCDGGRDEAEHLLVKNAIFDDLVSAPTGKYGGGRSVLSEGDLYVFQCWGGTSYGKMEVVALLDDGRTDAEALGMIMATPCALPFQRNDCLIASLAIVDLDGGDDISSGETQALTDLVRDLVQRTGRYTVVDRDSMMHILGEEDFMASVKCDNNRCIVNYGRKLRAQKMMHGRVNRAGSSMVLTLKMLDVSSAVVDAIETRRVDGGMDTLLDETQEATCTLLRRVMRKSTH